MAVLLSESPSFAKSPLKTARLLTRMMNLRSRPKAEPIWVVERSGSRSLGKGDHIGARLLALEPAIVSGAVYFFNSGAYLNLRSELFGKRRRATPDPTRISRSIVHEWLSVLVAALAMFVVGLFDDRLQLSPIAKLVASLAVGAFLVFALAGIEPVLPAAITTCVADHVTSSSVVTIRRSPRRSSDRT